MSRIKALVAISFPTSEDDVVLIDTTLQREIIQFFEQYYPPDSYDMYAEKICNKWCDTIPGWWNLNQMWYEFTSMIESSWGICRLTEISDDDWKNVTLWLNTGVLYMNIQYYGPIVYGFNYQSWNMIEHCCADPDETVRQKLHIIWNVGYEHHEILRYIVEGILHDKILAETYMQFSVKWQTFVPHC